ncbi:MAG: glycogen synthase GlgA [Verrucomicrobia bacterium]|nr:glycogen synthase GlgA [Verrucomicrobiota bacterium]
MAAYSGITKNFVAHPVAGRLRFVVDDGGRFPLYCQAMNIVMIASEMTPFAKTGGLGDVMGSLPHALSRRGHEIAAFIPLYRCVNTGSAEKLRQDRVQLGQRAADFTVYRIEQRRGVSVYAIGKGEYFDRDDLYGTGTRDYGDNAERFIFFSKAAVQAVQSLGLQPHVVHAHDWQAAFVPVQLRAGDSPVALREVPVVFTIHNLAFQGMFDAREFQHTNLPPHFFSVNGLEFYSHINLMKGGILFANEATTVSRRYAQEIQTPEHGWGLDGVLRARRNPVRGIMNGVDTAVWNPETDPHLPHPFTAKTLADKRKCKTALARELGLETSGKKPLFGVVSRFAQQKGMDLLLNTFPQMLKRGAAFAILGNGEARYEDAFRRLAGDHPRQIGLKIGFDDRLAHRIYAGSDFFLMPSLYEPCGLSQLYAMRYGAIPVVRATGGLDDSIQEWEPERRQGTGFKFERAEPEALMAALDRAMSVLGRPSLMAALRRNAMAADFSWEKSAREYEAIYESLQSYA